MASSPIAQAHNHLLSISQLSVQDIQFLFKRSSDLKSMDPRDRSRIGFGKSVALLFYENSTRTRISFEQGTRLIGATPILFVPEQSSVSKGETLLDTVQNLERMHVDSFVIRHPRSGVLGSLAQQVKTPILNAGDGMHEHPSQALLDSAFLNQSWSGEFAGKIITFVGDALHSRVIRSHAILLNKLGATVRVCGPPTLVPETFSTLGLDVYCDLEPAVKDAHAVVCLRVQQERIKQSMFASTADYSKKWRLEVKHLRLASPNVHVMHPGPVNWGVELAREFLEHPNSVILDQVEHGSWMRAALLERSLA